MSEWQHPLRAAREACHWSIDTLAGRTGLSRRTILRAERGLGLNPDSRRLLCAAFGMSAEELGLGARQQHPRAGRPGSGIDEVTRREFLRLVSIAGALLIAPPGPDPLDWERLGRLSGGELGLDPATLDQYTTLNAHLWRTFAAARSKGAALQLVRQQINVVTRHLERAHGQPVHERLCALASDLFQLAGEIFFDGNHYSEAAQCYTSAASAGREAGAHDLWACAMTRHAFIGVYERKFDRAIPMLEMADRVARRGDPALSTRHWVNAVRAQAFAGIGELERCQRAAGVAEEVAWLNGRVHNGGWLRFDSSRLDEERGACYVELGRPDLAEPALIEALGRGLSMRRRGIVLTDLATAGAQRNDADQLVTYGSAALDIAKSTGSGVIASRLSGLRTRAARFAGDADVRRLSAGIAALADGGVGAT
jgi:transcriptional regulator with XRE-family HTH domain